MMNEDRIFLAPRTSDKVIHITKNRLPKFMEISKI